MPRKKKTPFAVDQDNKLYIRTDAIMSPLIPYIDGLSITIFGGKGPSYLNIDQVIEWCRNELKWCVKSEKPRYEKAIEVMEKAKASVADGTAVFND